MAISQAYTGTATMSTTEFSLVSGSTSLTGDTTPAVIQVFIDTNNMFAGDEYEIKIKDRIISTDAQRTIYTATLDGAQSAPFVTPSLILYHAWDITMKQITGTARSISWSIRKVA